jgi:hypothetical protein
MVPLLRLAFTFGLPLCLAGVAAVVVAGMGADDPKADGDKSIVLGKQFGESVENGSAYDKATLDLGEVKRIAIPEGAEVVQGDDGRKIRVFLKKTLDFAGHPPEPMSIRTGRTKMGCATKVEGQTLVIATFGEWTSKEGGARIKLLLVVPKGVEVERRKGLAGSDSAAHPAPGVSPSERGETKDGYWYGPTRPTDGWQAARTDPDVDRRAEPSTSRKASDVNAR